MEQCPKSRALRWKTATLHLVTASLPLPRLMIQAELDENRYEKGIEISEDEFNEILIECDDFHGEWNYRILPRGFSIIE
jgi:Rhodopirellula transposase DDE domain